MLRRAGHAAVLVVALGIAVVIELVLGYSYVPTARGLADRGAFIRIDVRDASLVAATVAGRVTGIRILVGRQSLSSAEIAIAVALIVIEVRNGSFVSAPLVIAGRVAIALKDVLGHAGGSAFITVGVAVMIELVAGVARIATADGITDRIAIVVVAVPFNRPLKSATHGVAGIIALMAVAVKDGSFGSAKIAIGVTAVVVRMRDASYVPAALGIALGIAVVAVLVHKLGLRTAVAAVVAIDVTAVVKIAVLGVVRVDLVASVVVASHDVAVGVAGVVVYMVDRKSVV